MPTIGAATFHMLPPDDAPTCRMLIWMVSSRVVVMVLMIAAMPAAADPVFDIGAGVSSGYRPRETAMIVEGTAGFYDETPKPGTDRFAIISLHGLAAIGTSDAGRFSQVRIGAEAISCIGGGFLCALFGADVGLQWFGVADGTRVREPMLAVRPGIDLGIPKVRLRLWVELPYFDDHVMPKDRVYDRFGGAGAIAWRF